MIRNDCRSSRKKGDKSESESELGRGLGASPQTKAYISQGRRDWRKAEYNGKLGFVINRNEDKDDRREKRAHKTRGGDAEGRTIITEATASPRR